ncbi:DUF551 domain-containing protein [Yersinia enterocolitica]|nr:DUF551 domain-containing protein [Yersinia enterocolitica]HEG1706996.1 DUF551 domain-containing protein [Yersinia enterocolitica]
MKELDGFTVEQLNDFIKSDHAQCGDVAALARIALAAKRAEPVAWVVGDATLYNSDTVEAYAKRSGLPVSPLYTTPQLNSPEIPEGWIKCSDHRPERGTDVQVYCSDTREQFVAFHIGNGEFQYAQHEDTSIACRPSHWMPLLAAPEKENG